MTTFTAWKFDTPEGAQEACDVLDQARRDGLVEVVDRAVLDWPEGDEAPQMRHTREGKWRATGRGGFWGLLIGTVFFAPVVGAAAGAAIAGGSQHMQGVGLTKDEIERLRHEVTPGTSLLMAVTERGDQDRLFERFTGIHARLVSTNLTGPERDLLLESFGS